MTRAQRIEAALKAVLPHLLAVHDKKRHPAEMALAIQAAQDALLPEPAVQPNNQIIEFSLRKA